ncbi:MAG: cell division protein FtsB [Gammaproteobacteria bacterium]|nr:cell division protein FtsB [Gammaproteobacteria bacterium]MBU2478426.1 cell division protein FtsB [Gammaproteobacteria bacterium]
MRRWLIVILIALLLGLQYKLWVGDGSLAEVWHLHTAVGEQRLDNEQLAERNAALEAEVNDLKQGLDAVEERARSELGMIKDDEVFYQLVEPEGK